MKPLKPMDSGPKWWPMCLLSPEKQRLAIERDSKMKIYDILADPSTRPTPPVGGLGRIGMDDQGAGRHRS